MNRFFGNLFIILLHVYDIFKNLFKRSSIQVKKYQSVKYPIVNLSPQSKYRLCTFRRKILVLDLDETLVHSNPDSVYNHSDMPSNYVLRIVIDHHPSIFYISKRPHVDYFLDIVSEWYDLVVYTASLEVYGAAIADYLDNGRHILQRRYYRQHCESDNGLTKNLTLVSGELSSVFILDNSPTAYKHFPDNAIPIKSWFSDPNDTALLCLLPFLDALRFVSDVRSVLSRNLHRANSFNFHTPFGNIPNRNLNNQLTSVEAYRRGSPTKRNSLSM